MEKEKMTPQKAIKFFDEEIARLNYAPELNGCEMTEEWREQLEICKLAKSAIEKQILQKPEHDNGAWSICPACFGSVPNDTEEAVNHETSYCDHCGQALDWSGVQ